MTILKTCRNNVKLVETIEEAPVLHPVLDFKYSSTSFCVLLASRIQAYGSSSYEVKPIKQLLEKRETILMVSYICSEMLLGEGSVVRPSEEPNEVGRGSAGLCGAGLVFVWFRRFPAR